MPTDRLLEVVDIGVAAVSAAWSPTGNDLVAREYGKEAERKSIVGRQVYMFPLGDGEADRLTRDEVEWFYKFVIVIVERYTTAPGLPPKAWMDERLLFARTKVYDVLNVDEQANYLGTPPTLYTHSITRDVAYDFEEYRDHSTFWCEIEVELREVVTG